MTPCCGPDTTSDRTQLISSSLDSHKSRINGNIPCAPSMLFRCSISLSPSACDLASVTVGSCGTDLPLNVQASRPPVSLCTADVSVHFTVGLVYLCSKLLLLKADKSTHHAFECLVKQPPTQTDTHLMK